MDKKNQLRKFIQRAHRLGINCKVASLPELLEEVELEFFNSPPDYFYCDAKVCELLADIKGFMKAWRHK